MAIESKIAACADYNKLGCMPKECIAKLKAIKETARRSPTLSEPDITNCKGSWLHCVNLDRLFEVQ